MSQTSMCDNPAVVQTVVFDGPFKIADVKPISWPHSLDGDVVITLDSGRSITIRDAVSGQAEYPRAGFDLMLSRTISNRHVIVADPARRGGHDYDPMHGRVYFIAEITG